ncbi:MAG TPA: hypothetical protein VFZ53_34540 [Polyangiaceae bacterium]
MKRPTSTFPRAHTALAFLAAFAAHAFAPETALAQSTIRAHGDRPSYGVELEPHLLATPFDPPGIGDGEGVGLGVRGTFEILSQGFIPRLNDSVGIGFGLDWIHYSDSDVDGGGECQRTEQAPGGIPVCVEVAGDTDYLWIPVVMQWNFWLHERWSAFGEPGIALRLDDMDDFRVSPIVLFVGGRYHVSDTFTLTMRLGYPAFSFGGSFLF